MDQLLTGYCL